MVEIKFVGIDGTVSKVQRKALGASKAIHRALGQASALVERDSKLKAPVRTGRLRSSIESTVYDFYATVIPKTDYAVYVHEGTVHMAARPFLKDAMEQNADRIRELFRAAVASAMNA